jgi:hypothetical protein
MKKIFNNYKTTIPGLLGIISVGIYWMGYITTEQFTSGIGFLFSVGLLGARDYDKKETNDKTN